MGSVLLGLGMGDPGPPQTPHKEEEQQSRLSCDSRPVIPEEKGDDAMGPSRGVWNPTSAGSLRRGDETGGKSDPPLPAAGDQGHSS